MVILGAGGFGAGDAGATSPVGGSEEVYLGRRVADTIVVDASAGMGVEREGAC